VKSLTERGAPTVYTGDALMKIGMPVGGLCCGTLYLGGDGKLWLWDIFNRNQEGAVGRTVNYGGQKVPPRNGACYVVPPTDQPSPLEQGFALRVKMAGGEPQIRTLDRKGWNDVRFTGSYPVGTVDYADPACPVQVRLQAFSPFIPLNVDDSSLPATIMRYTITNTGKQAVTVDIGGWLENTVLKSIGDAASRSNRHMETKLISSLICTAGNAPAEAGAALRPDVVFEDFEKETYEGWTVKGTAFGTGPISKDKVPAYQGDLGMVGNRAVNSHACAPGTDLGVKDGQTGSLLSREFTIERNYLRFLIGGGNHPPKTCLNLLVDGKIVRTATGHNNNQMRQEAFNVRDLAGKKAQIEILDQESGAWANIGIDQIVFSDRSGLPPMVLEKRPDFGSMTLSVLDMQPVHSASPIDPAALPGALFSDKTEATGTDRLIGGMVCRDQTINPGKSATITFAITWYFPNVRFGIQGDDTGRHYSKKFADAEAVAEYLATNQKRLIDTTLLWRDTWYESSLPCWFLDRTFANTSILATTTAHRFANGRFYAWEGIGCCPGTCSHVWHYGQAMGRIFPELERNVREQVDFGLAFDDNSGVIGYRAEHGRGPAADGQCGRILGMLREHQMSPDNQFLKHNWPRVKMAILYLMHHDLDNDGILDGAQENTLDAAWFGQIPWISGLYAAALMAGKEMATDMNDFEFARGLRTPGAAKPHVDRTKTLQWRMVHPDQGSCPSQGIWLLQWLRHRPGVWPKLGLAGRPGPGSRQGKDGFGPAVAVEIQLCPRSRPFHQWHPGQGPALLRARRRRPGDGHQSVAGGGSLWRQPLDGHVLQRMHERLRAPGGLAHDRRGNGHRRTGGHPRHPRPLPRREAQSLQRGRVLRPLCPRHGQLRILHLRLRLHQPWPEGDDRFRAAPESAGLQGCIHRRRRLGHLQPETGQGFAGGCTGSEIRCRHPPHRPACPARRHGRQKGRSQARPGDDRQHGFRQWRDSLDRLEGFRHRPRREDAVDCGQVELSTKSTESTKSTGSVS
jgi:hypothetical protein